MKKRNPVVGAILGLFIWGLFYATGFNKDGLIKVLGLCVLSWAVVVFISPQLGMLVSIAGAYLGYRWTEERNEAIDAAESTNT